MNRAFGLRWMLTGMSGVFVVGAVGLIVAGFVLGGEATLPMVIVGVTLLVVAVVLGVVRRYVNSLDPTELLATGTPGTALIVSVRDTGVTINELNAVFELELDVTVPPTPVYRATTRITVGRVSFGTVQPGMTVAVKVDPEDHTRVAVDWEASPAGSGDTLQVPGMDGPVRVAGFTRAADIVAEGVATTGTIVAMAATGRTADEFNTEMLDSITEYDDPIVMMEIDVAGPGGTYRIKNLYRVPDGRSQHLVLGATIPIAYLPEDPEGSAVVAWDRF